MYTAKDVALKIILPFALKRILFFAFYSVLICVIYTFLDLKNLGIPFLPVGLIGTAVAFYVGFKNNSSYERLWEGRRIWGSIVNSSRTFASFVLSYTFTTENVSEEELKEIQTRLIYRNIAFINALRIRLRNTSTWETHQSTASKVVDQFTPFKNDDLGVELKKFLPLDEAEKLLRTKNPVTQILNRQSMELRDLFLRGVINEFRQMELGRIIGELYNQQGACERIKTFPFPRQYAFFSKVFVWIFIIILPFGLLAELAKIGESYIWLTIPFYVVISWVFYTMEVVGDSSENPFENGINDVPMTAICRNIEIDLREMLEEPELPAKITAINNILM
jgi:ion channel-forming bestrophin family protein